MTTSANNKRLAKNTIMLYIRMLITLIVSLYTSRVVLKVLGVEDFGIYNVVGGIVVVLSFLNNSMSSATQRFLNYELGTGNKERAKIVFSTSLVLHLLISFTILILALSVGFYFLEFHMNISPNRMVAARFVYLFSVLTFVFQTLTVPYNSLLIAHEKMSIYAYLSIIEVLAKLLIVYVLQVVNEDKLTFYAFLLFIVSIIIRIAYIIYSKYNFNEAIYNRRYIEKSIFNEMFKFSSWSIVGNLGYILHTQGISIVTNIYFNAVVNAAQGIANQINSAVTSFTANFQVALNPQIVKTYAAKELESMHSLIFRGCKFSFLLVAIFAVPIIIETPQILDLWLTEVPADTAIFVRLILVVTLINSFSNIMSISQGATGNVKMYQIVLTLLGFLHIPFALIAFELDFPAYYATVVYIFLSLILMTVRVIFVSKSVNLSLISFIKDVCVPCFIVLIVGLSVSTLFHKLLPTTVLGFTISILFSTLVMLLAIYFIGLNSKEKDFLLKQINSFLGKA